MTKIELIDEITGDIISALFPDLKQDSDEHDRKYTIVHNILTEIL